MTDIHSMPTEFGAMWIIFAVPVLIICSFIIRISHNEYLWREVIQFVDYSPLILMVAWFYVAISFILIGAGITIMILKDPKTRKDD